MRRLLAAVLLACACCAAYAQQTMVMGIEELFSMASELSLENRSYAVRKEIAGLQAEAAQRQMLPSIEADVYVGHPGQVLLPEWANTYTIGLSQPVYAGGRLREQYRSAMTETRRAGLEQSGNLAKVKMELLGYYLDLYSLYKRKMLLEKKVDEDALRLEDIRRMREQGIVTANDELRADLQLTDDRLTLNETVNGIAILSLTLDVLLGMDPATVPVPDTSRLNSFAFPGLAAEEYLGSAMEGNYSLGIAVTESDLAESSLKLARSSCLPQVSLSAGYSAVVPLVPTAPGQQWNLGVGLSMDIAALYRRRPEIGAARKKAELAENEYMRLAQQVRIDVMTAYIRHTEALDRIGQLNASVGQARENYRIVSNRYRNQLSILTDVLDASNVLLEAELQLAVARGNAVYTYYDLLRICGKI